MGRIVVAGLVLFNAFSLMAKDHPKVKIEVIGSETSERHVARYIPGTNSQSSTSCYGNATGTRTGNTTTANGSSNCYTTTTPGQEAKVVHGVIPQVHVRAAMADGRHVTLWCQAALRKCENMAAGFYGAEIDGSSLWIYSSDLAGNARKVKYRYVGGW